MEVIEKIDNFIALISNSRFEKYLFLTEKDKKKAVELYSLNSVISQSLYVPIQGLEIALRNKINNCLKEKHGEYWFDKPNLLKEAHQLEDVGFVKARIFQQKRKEVAPISHDRLVAGFSFGFWTALFGHDYEELWRQDLKEISDSGVKGINRKTFSGSLDNIRRLRNRIAHHECILLSDLKDNFSKILYLASLLSKETEHWIKQNSNFENLYNENKEVLNKLRK